MMIHCDCHGTVFMYLDLCGSGSFNILTYSLCYRFWLLYSCYVQYLYFLVLVLLSSLQVSVIMPLCCMFAFCSLPQSQCQAYVSQSWSQCLFFLFYFDSLVFVCCVQFYFSCLISVSCVPTCGLFPCYPPCVYIVCISLCSLSCSPTLQWFRLFLFQSVSQFILYL